MTALVIDNFAGGGGASTGIEAAFGRPVDVAINHDPEAVAMHMANHPDTRHLCQSIMAIDPRDACAVDGRVRKVGFAWFSPDCKHHSKAKGGQPREKNIRDLAWVVVHWPERLGDNAPDVIALENVEEFRHWGPLDENGFPIKERKGEEFDLWVCRLERCGYKVEWRELRACDYGAPTSRNRLYLIARRDGQPIVWPAPTHGKPDSADVLSGKLQPWRTAAECIDWSIVCPSIFDRQRPLKDATLRRIAHGTMRYVVNAARPFIVGTALTNTRALDVQSPLGTVVAGGVKHAAVTAFLSNFYSSNTAAGGGDPTDPAKSVTAGGQHHAVVCAHVEQANGGFAAGQPGRPATVPLSTVTATGSQQRLVETTLIDADALPPDMMERVTRVAAFLIKYYGAAEHGQTVDTPLHSITALPRFAVVTVTIDANTYVIVDIGMRMLTPRELARAQGFPDTYVLDPVGPNGKPLSKKAQIRMIGNSVCPGVATAIAEANLPAALAAEQIAA